MYRDLRRLLASIDYRFALAVRDASADFGTFAVGEGARTPLQIVGHLCDLVHFILDQFEPETTSPGTSTTAPSGVKDFEEECLRFRLLLRRLDGLLAAGVRFTPTREGLDLAGLLQGPISDALTHVGQLTLLRRLAGSPVERVRYWQVEMPLPSESR